MCSWSGIYPHQWDHCFLFVLVKLFFDKSYLIRHNRGEGRKCLYFMTLLTHFTVIWSQTYGKKTTQQERKPASGTSLANFLISSKGSFIYQQDNRYHSLCYTSHRALAGTRNSSWFHYEESIQRPIGSWADALTMELHLAVRYTKNIYFKSCNV